jgi:uncharacterized protein YdhG (YjbR/CyaY superfamily)
VRDDGPQATVRRAGPNDQWSDVTQDGVRKGSAAYLHLAIGRCHRQNPQVSAEEVDEYLNALDEPKRTTLSLLRLTILAILPEAEQGISYGAPAFKVRGRTISGFAAFKNHLSYLPHSGSVFPELADDLRAYQMSSGALRFAIDEPLPRAIVEKLIAVRLRQALPG